MRGIEHVAEPCAAPTGLSDSGRMCWPEPWVRPGPLKALDVRGGRVLLRSRRVRTGTRTGGPPTSTTGHPSAERFRRCQRFGEDLYAQVDTTGQVAMAADCGHGGGARRTSTW